MCSLRPHSIFSVQIKRLSLLVYFKCNENLDTCKTEYSALPDFYNPLHLLYLSTPTTNSTSTSIWELDFLRAFQKIYLHFHRNNFLFPSTFSLLTQHVTKRCNFRSKCNWHRHGWEQTANSGKHTAQLVTVSGLLVSGVGWAMALFN